MYLENNKINIIRETIAIIDLVCAEHELEHVRQRKVQAKELLVHGVEALLDEVREERHVAHGEQPVVWLSGCLARVRRARRLREESAEASELRVHKRAHLCAQFVQKVTRLRRCLRHALVQNVLRVCAVAQKLRSLYQKLFINNEKVVRKGIKA